MELILGLGSNLGDRISYLKKAIQKISAFMNVHKIAPVYESDAQLTENCPKEWNKKFLNTAILGDTTLPPQEILVKIKSIEKELGRQDAKEKWGPREIDIDILSLDNTVLNSDILSIPHQHLLERPFALWPLADICPQWKYPALGKNHGIAALELAKNFKGNIFNTIKTDIELK